VRIRLGGLLLIGSVALGCGDDAPPMSDAGCATDSDCSDGVWCNGDEVCSMGACQPGELPCEDACDELSEMCIESCATPDADGDGVDSLGCGGDDCDDTDANRYPGNTEICDAEGVDEDCDPETLGDLDVDGDGHISAECCNGTRCGDDCADRLADVFGGATETCDLRDQDCDGDVDEGVAIMLFEDLDGDLYGDMTTVQACPGLAKTSTSDIDCEPGVATRHGAQLEVCDGLNNDCDDAIDEKTVEQPWYPDTDGDGFGDPGEEPIVACAPPEGYSLLPLDCDDDDGTLYPAASELCNARDDNCDGIAGYVIAPGDTEDDDRDGYADASCGGDDCDDEDPFNYPGGLELCDELDNDCDGEVDEMVMDVEWYVDADGDGFGDSTTDVVTSCERQPGRVLRGGDCADGNPVIHPDVVERCNGVDDDCDGTVDEGGLGGVRGYRDDDGDGFGLTSDSVFACGDALPSGYVPVPGDCDDSDAARFPTAADDCDSVDDDCDGVVDEDGALTWYEDGDDDGYGGATVVAEQCNQPTATATAMGGDCDDTDSTIVPMGVESCDGVDQDCDGRIDESLPLTSYFPDADGDGYALDTATAVMACGPEAGFTDATGDCDDTNADVSPDGTEICDGLDNDCNSTVDDTATTSLCAGGANTTGICLPPPAAVDTCECTDDLLYRDCDGAPFNGCEAVLATDSNNCGDCGNACPTGQRCVSGSCAPSAILEIDGGPSGYCVLRDNDLAYCWGGNRNYHLGGLSSTAVAIPSSFNTVIGGRVVSIAENSFNTNAHSCQIVEYDGSGVRDIRCWGHNQGGQLGIGTVTSSQVTSATPIVPAVDDLVDDWAQVVTDGGNFTLARTTSGDVYSWGTNGNSFAGYLGRDTGGAIDPVPALVTGVSGATDIAMSPGFGCAVVADGRILCWGTESNGTAPNTGGGSADVNGWQAQPVRIIGGSGEEDLMGAVQVEAHRFGGCARMSDGRVYCWGNNAIGDGSATSIGTAVPALGVSAASSLACGENACCAVVGTNVMCWGDNAQGQLGRGTTTTNELTPALVQLEDGLTNLSGIVEVAAARYSFCARTMDHRVVCWGDGSERQTGIDAQTDRPHAGAPTYIEGL
jgi:hypothetical protein